jgi:hypothetical protein
MDVSNRIAELGDNNNLHSYCSLTKFGGHFRDCAVVFNKSQKSIAAWLRSIH